MKLLLAILLLTATANAKLNVITSTTDVAYIVSQVGGDKVEVESLLRGTENPHFVDTVPNFIRKAADADVVCSVGLDLEVGWMPKVLAKSGNAKVQPGGAGFCEVGKSVDVLERPTGAIDRSLGDVHPSGNPHFWMSPIALAQAAKEVARVLGNVDPDNKAVYESNLASFQGKMEALQKTNQSKLDAATKGLTGPALLEYHKEFTYLFNVYHLKSAGSLEEKPGVPPSAGRLGEVALDSKKTGVKALLAAETNPRKILDRYTELSGIPVIRVTASVPKGEDYEKWHNALVSQIVEAISGKKHS